MRRRRARRTWSRSRCTSSRRGHRPQPRPVVCQLCLVRRCAQRDSARTHTWLDSARSSITGPRPVRAAAPRAQRGVPSHGRWASCPRPGGGLSVPVRPPGGRHGDLRPAARVHPRRSLRPHSVSHTKIRRPRSDSVSGSMPPARSMCRCRSALLTAWSSWRSRSARRQNETAGGPRCRSSGHRREPAGEPSTGTTNPQRPGPESPEPRSSRDPARRATLGPGGPTPPDPGGLPAPRSETPSAPAPARRRRAAEPHQRPEPRHRRDRPSDGQL